MDRGLFAANADEREGALEVLEERRDFSVPGDKGSLGQWRQAILHEEQALLLLTPKRKNPHAQNTRAWDALMKEKPGARSGSGILSRVIAKITGRTIAANRRGGP